RRSETDETVTASGGPGELRRRDPGLALVPDTEGIDARALRLRRVELRGDRMEHADEPDGLARLDSERDDVLDLEVDRVPDADAVAQALLADLDRRALDAEDLADERDDRRHGPAHLPAEHRGELLELHVGRVPVDEHAESPVALGH